MSKKVLVTKEFHRKALKAIKDNETYKDLAATEELRMAWMSYIECQISDEELEKFSKYVKEFHKEILSDG